MSKQTPTLQDLVIIDRKKYPNYYINPISKKITWRGRIKGKSKKISTGKTTIKEAKQVVEDKMLDLLSNNPQKDRREKKGIKNHTMSDIWTDLMDERRPQKDPSTMAGYDVSWRISIEPFWGVLTALDINPPTVRKFENWYLKHHPSRVFFNTRKHLIMLFNSCRAHGYIAQVPDVSKLDETIATRFKKKKTGRVYSEIELTDMLANASPRTQLGILFGRYMGMRKMEFLSLKWENVDQKNWIASVWSNKNKKWREVPVPEQVKAALQEYAVDHKKYAYIFHGVKDSKTHISSQVFDKDWTRSKELAGISQWNVENAARIHDLRHTFATQTARDNWPPMVACEVLDMSLKEYQRTYVHISKNDVRLMMNKSFGGLK